ncbi:oxidoreductase [Acrasis kona]|uniref:Oxidoreductase n=1 Tax=Acrasis kona TaxID=1008807 RepID=A0AAW2YZK6_9EUKA
MAELIKNAIQGVKDALNEEEFPSVLPPQHQEQHPGIEAEMTPTPVYDREYYRGSGKLLNKSAIITGGDSGIGRSVAILFAKEGADVVISYVPAEQQDAEKVRDLVQSFGRRCVLYPGDLKDSSYCKQLVEKSIQEFGKLDILVNNAAVQYMQEDIVNISDEQLDVTFRTNIYSQFYMCRAAIPHLKEGSSIICTTSVNAYHGHPKMLDYSSTKGAIIAFVRSLAQQLYEKKIRVNAVAPGPIWTPFIPSSFPAAMTSVFGKEAPMGRPGQPFECGTSYVFLASEDSTYFTGQCLHPNGGMIVNC